MGKSHVDLSPQRAQRTQSAVTIIEFIDIFNLCISVSSVQSVFHPNKIVKRVSAFIGVMLAVTHRHICPRAYVDAPSQGATRSIHLRLIFHIDTSRLNNEMVHL